MTLTRLLRRQQVQHSTTQTIARMMAVFRIAERRIQLLSNATMERKRRRIVIVVAFTEAVANHFVTRSCRLVGCG